MWRQTVPPLTISLPAVARAPRAWSGDQLYRETTRRAESEIMLTFVPYFAWGNRGDTEMTVWLPAR